LLVVVPGLLSGCTLSTNLLAAHNPGTIVVELTRMQVATDVTANGGAKRSTAQTTTTMSITGRQTSFFEGSFTRPGYQQAQTGDWLELYDPSDHTIYVTTRRAWEAATTRQFDQSLPKGPESTSSSSSISFTYAYAPGRTSVFEQQLRAHLYKLAGQTKIDGRIALKLVPTHRAVAGSAHPGAHEVLGTVYVEPGTYDPIKEVTHTGLGPDFGTTIVDTWLVYKVLPATAANLKLLSLKARHPSARVVHSASGYLKASNSESKAVRIRPTGL